MLTGTVPFPRDSTGAMMYAHLNDVPVPPSRRCPGLPARLDAVVATAMAKLPKHRYNSCGELAAAARAAVSGAPLRDIVMPGRSWVRIRRRWLIGAAAAVTVVAAAVAGTMSATIGSAGHPVAAPATPVTYSPALKAVLWGAYSYIADAFPALLPVSVDAVGYGGLSMCQADDDNDRMVSLYQPVPVGRLICQGDDYPIYVIIVVCDADRSQSVPEVADFQVDGEERWTRPSGTGYLRWGSSVSDTGKPWARLEVYFDSPQRNFCHLEVYGRGTGAALHTDWWPNVPV
jgi:serine/threonine-protein kinase